MGDNYHINNVEKVVRKLLPKFVEKYESQHNFKLPKINVFKISGSIANSWRVMSGEEKLSFGYVAVKVVVDVKDGRIGRVKKLIINLVERVLDSLFYGYHEIYVEFIKNSELEKEKIEELENSIHGLLTQNHRYKGEYILPHSNGNNEVIDWIVNVVPYGINLVQPNANYLNTDENCLYNVKIVLMVYNMFIGNKDNNEWRRGYDKNDLPESVLDEIRNNVEKKIKDFTPNICDCEIKFKFTI